MIAKNIKGKSFKGCVSYVMHEGATLLEAEGVLADSKQDIIHSFAMQRSGREEIKQPVGHIPLSFSPEDKERMTDEFMTQLAKEYMQEMGIRNTQYIIVRHDNTENPHLHIVYNRIDNELKLISVNHDYKRNIKVCKKLKDKHHLTYGDGKEKVKREKLDNPDAVKYLLFVTKAKVKWYGGGTAYPYL
ncbi:MAG: relaxase/mobilization nuclease domain-containing protein [Dysgonamonadaceae bacterium]|jgi:type IV secretory pathway VirD2 relaxase|nr:relaxase/mobilization nuclease domain-containing protein [Dysgonamonadaceae bacterium]